MAMAIRSTHPQGQSPALRDVVVFDCFTVPQVHESPQEHEEPVMVGQDE